MVEPNRLILSAQEIKQITGWPDAMVEDYLNILTDTQELGENIDEDSERIDALDVRVTALELQVNAFIAAQTIINNAQTSTNAAVQLDLKKLEQLAYA